MECKHCKEKMRDTGYRDGFYHFWCPNCGCLVAGGCVTSYKNQKQENIYYYPRSPKK